MSKATIIWKSIGTGLVACLLIGAVVWGYRMAPTDEPCVSLEINISDQDERMYLSETELTGLLQTADLYPVGRKQDLVSLHRIEQAIRQHPMVRPAECYMTPRREVKIKLTQRVPLLLVSKADELYFIDTDRRVMPFRERVKDKLLKVTGTVSKQAAATQLADFALWLQDNSYWRNRIALLYQADENKHSNTFSKRVKLGLAPLSALEKKSFECLLVDNLNDNLNSAAAFSLIDNSELTLADWQKIDELFGLNLIDDTPDIPNSLKDLIKQREQARTDNDFAIADKIRQELEANNIIINDTPTGSIWEYKA